MSTSIFEDKNEGVHTRVNVLKVDQAAEILKVSPETIRKWIARGVLPVGGRPKGQTSMTQLSSPHQLAKGSGA